MVTDEETNSKQNQKHKQRSAWRARIEFEDVMIVLCGYFFLSLVGSGVLAALGATSDPGIGVTLSMASGVVAAAVSVGALAITNTIVTPASIGLKHTSVRWLLIGAGFGVLAWFLSIATGALYAWISGDLTDPRPELGAAYRETNLEFAFLVIVGGLLVPFGEELVFRGVLYTWLRRWGIVVAMGVSTIVFGLLHGGGLLFFTSALLSVLAAFAYERSESLWPAIVAHSVVNTIMFVSGRLFPL